MNEQTPNEFTNEQYATFDQYLEEQIKRLKVSIDREVPESGPFKDVFDLFTNPDEGSRDGFSSCWFWYKSRASNPHKRTSIY